MCKLKASTGEMPDRLFWCQEIWIVLNVVELKKGHFINGCRWVWVGCDQSEHMKRSLFRMYLWS